LSSSQGMKAHGRSRRYILSLWPIAVIIGTISAGIGFSFLSNTSPAIISIAISFAAGAILVMLAESMIPEAHEEEEGGGGIGVSRIGLATMAGFAIAFILGRLEGG
jgi:zinc transporter, ZIP family